MALGSNWSDGTKWLMGILGALIVATLIALMNLKKEPPPAIQPEQSATPANPGSAQGPRPAPNPSAGPFPKPTKIAGSTGTSPIPTTKSTPSMSSTPSMPLPTPPPTSDTRLQTAEGFEFLLDKCAMEGEHLNCWLKVTNVTGQGRLSIFRDGSWLKDQDDNKHEVWRVLESNGKPEFNILQLRDLSRNSPERFGLHFKGLNGSVTLIKYLNLHTRDFSLGWRDVEVK